MYTYIESLFSLSIPSPDPFLLILPHPRTLQWRQNVTWLCCSAENWHEAYFRFKFHFRPGVDKRLPWCLQTFAVVSTNVCRGVFRLLPWCRQTFAVVFTNFCRGVDKLLPWPFQTFAVVFTNFCRGVFRLSLPWCSQTFAVVSTNFCRGDFKLFPCLPNRFFVSFKIKLQLPKT